MPVHEGLAVAPVLPRIPIIHACNKDVFHQDFCFPVGRPLLRTPHRATGKGNAVMSSQGWGSVSWNANTQGILGRACFCADNVATMALIVATKILVYLNCHELPVFKSNLGLTYASFLPRQLGWVNIGTQLFSSSLDARPTNRQQTFAWKCVCDCLFSFTFASPKSDAPCPSLRHVHCIRFRIGVWLSPRASACHSIRWLIFSVFISRALLRFLSQIVSTW